MIRRLIALLILSLAIPVQARIWHVTPRTLAGVDPNDQVRTIGAAAAHLDPGDIILLHSGIYRELVTVDKNGTSDKPITIRAAEGESVILTGADRLTDWSLIPGGDRVYSTPWPHKFIAWNKSYTHPNDDYHRLIGRCEQVFVNGYPLHQVLERDKLSRGTFFADIDAQRLYVQPAGNQDITKDKAMVEASTREQILQIKGSYVVVKGIRFRYAANHAQQGAVQFSGDHTHDRGLHLRAHQRQRSGLHRQEHRRSQLHLPAQRPTRVSERATPTACG